MTNRLTPAGFTLVELLMAIVVLGIVAAMAITQFEPDVAAQLNSFGNVVAADLMQARQLAVANNTKYRLTFEKSENRYRLEHSGTNPSYDALPPTIYRNALNTTTRQYVDLDELPHLGPNTALESVLVMTSPATTATELEFGPLGATTAAAETVVWLTAGSGASQRWAAVRVNAVTGLVQVDDVSGTGPAGSGS